MMELEKLEELESLRSWQERNLTQFLTRSVILTDFQCDESTEIEESWAILLSMSANAAWVLCRDDFSDIVHAVLDQGSFREEDITQAFEFMNLSSNGTVNYLEFKSYMVAVTDSSQAPNAERYLRIGKARPSKVIRAFCQAVIKDRLARGARNPRNPIPKLPNYDAQMAANIRARSLELAIKMSSKLYGKGRGASQRKNSMSSSVSSRRGSMQLAAPGNSFTSGGAAVGPQSQQNQLRQQSQEQHDEQLQRQHSSGSGGSGGKKKHGFLNKLTSEFKKMFAANGEVERSLASTNDFCESIQPQAPASFSAALMEEEERLLALATVDPAPTSEARLSLPNVPSAADSPVKLAELRLAILPVDDETASCPLPALMLGGRSGSGALPSVPLPPPAAVRPLDSPATTRVKQAAYHRTNSVDSVLAAARTTLREAAADAKGGSDKYVYGGHSTGTSDSGVHLHSQPLPPYQRLPCAASATLSQPLPAMQATSPIKGRAHSTQPVSPSMLSRGSSQPLPPTIPRGSGSGQLLSTSDSVLVLEGTEGIWPDLPSTGSAEISCYIEPFPDSPTRSHSSTLPFPPPSDSPRKKTIPTARRHRLAGTEPGSAL